MLMRAVNERCVKGTRLLGHLQAIWQCQWIPQDLTSRPSQSQHSHPAHRSHGCEGGMVPWT